MGMYNVIFGQPDLGYELLIALGYSKVSDVGRFRDAWIEAYEGGHRIAVYTRNGANRVDLSGHPLYLSDKVDTFDDTYATIYFQVPEHLAPVLLSSPEIHPEPVDTSKMWLDARARMETDPEYAALVQSRFDSGQFVSIQSIDPKTGEAGPPKPPSEAMRDLASE